MDINHFRKNTNYKNINPHNPDNPHNPHNPHNPESTLKLYIMIFPVPEYFISYFYSMITRY